MGIPGEAYKALQSIVGPEWVSDDPAICEADTRGGAFTGIMDRLAVRPACSVQPQSAEEVQQITRLANSYKLPFIPTSTFFTAACAPLYENTIMMDLKRMNKYEIDEQNMYAIVEPGISFSMLQAELLKRGLFTLVPGCGAQASVLANHVHLSEGGFGWRMGVGYRRILAAEWVLPDGELLRLGSRSMFEDFFWGEGPGPDLRALVRGNEGHEGGLGTVTKMAVKVFPFIPEKLEPQGVGPRTTLKLPENRLKWYIIVYPSIEKAIDGMYELGRAEIGLVVMTVPPIFRYVARARGKGANQFWEAWNKAADTLDREEAVVRVLLFGWTSEQQLDYEEKVLIDIADESGGVAQAAGLYDESYFMAADSISVNFIGRRFLTQVYIEALDNGLKTGLAGRDIKEKHTPPMAETYFSPGWFMGYELAHFAKEESFNFSDIEDVGHIVAEEQECRENDIRIGSYPIFEDTRMFGPVWFDYDKKMKGVKETFDPNNLSHPPRPLARLA